MKNGKPYILILLGSKSDIDITKDGIKFIRDMDVRYSLKVSSAHRMPDKTMKLAKDAEKEGYETIIAVAGKAAHLAGVVAAHTNLPVIGVPNSGNLNGIEALLSTVEMPQGVPVACMGIGKHGFFNACLLSLKVISLRDSDLKEKVREYISNQKSLLKKEAAKYEEEG